MESVHAYIIAACAYVRLEYPGDTPLLDRCPHRRYCVHTLHKWLSWLQWKIVKSGARSAQTSGAHSGQLAPSGGWLSDTLRQLSAVKTGDN